MSGSRRLRFLPAPPRDGRPGRFGPGDCYPTAVWLPVMGPAGFVAWQQLARALRHHPGGITTTLDRLAVDIGLGAPGSQHGTLARTLRRLERFGVVRQISDELYLVRVELPTVSPAQLRRLHPAVQARHSRLAARHPTPC